MFGFRKIMSSERGKEEVMDMLYKYTNVFSLRDEIGTCPNTEPEKDVTDKSSFFTSPFHVKEEDNTTLYKEMKRLCYLGIIKDVFSIFHSRDVDQ